MTSKRTPIADQEQKNDIIEHLNDDHQAELCAMITDYVDNPDDANPQIDDIFEEGCVVYATHHDQRQPYFIPFQLKGELEEKIMHLAYVAMVKQGKPLGGQKKRYFEVRETQKITDNMLRLVLKTTQDLPENTPGFAYLFAQKTLEKAPSSPHVGEAQRVGRIGIAVNRLFLWVMKLLSSRQRQRVLASMNKGMRYYTLQSAHHSNTDNTGRDIAWVDVFLHGDTAGSVWAQGLKSGDIVISTNEYAEHTEHLQQGKTLLIADETSLPTLLALLQQWQNPQPPTVIVLTQQPSEQAYLPDTVLPAGSVCHRLVGDLPALSEQLMTQLTGLDGLESTWGGLEQGLAKQVRTHLRDTHQLTSKQNRIRAYWRADSDSN